MVGGSWGDGQHAGVAGRGEFCAESSTDGGPAQSEWASIAVPASEGRSWLDQVGANLKGSELAWVGSPGMSTAKYLFGLQVWFCPCHTSLFTERERYSQTTPRG